MCRCSKIRWGLVIIAASSSAGADLTDVGSTTARGAPSSEPLAAQQVTSPKAERAATPELTPLPAVVETLSLLTVMRSAEAVIWPDPFAFDRVHQWPKHYEEAFTRRPLFDPSRHFMEWDGDRWPINTIGHGLLGSELYLRPRRCGFGAWGSFAYAAAASALWEYGFEGNGVRPSGLDLLYTPLSGVLLGEARFQAWRLTGTLENATWRAVLGGLLDPVGEFSTGVLGAPC